MKFSEFLNRREVESFNLDYSEKCNKELILIDIDSLLTEYNAYLQEQQNKPVTSDFLLELGFSFFENYIKNNDFYTKHNTLFDISICFDSEVMIIESISQDFKIPFPKTQKDVLDLMRLLDIEKFPKPNN